MAESRAKPGAISESASSYEMVVSGGGQAGPAMGYFLQRQGRNFVTFEAADSIGSAWRARWESLTLFTPHRYNSLPSLPFPGDPEGYPNRDEVIAYLEEYAETFELPIELSSPVWSLTAETAGLSSRRTAGWRPPTRLLSPRARFRRRMCQRWPAGSGRTSSRRTALLPQAGRPAGGEKRFVAGGGNTGFQIAKELSAMHKVYLSVGSRQTPLPQRFLGRDLFWWLTKSRLFNTTVESRLGERLKTRETLIGSSPGELKRHYGVTLKPRAVDANGRTVRFADGSELEVDAVIWDRIPARLLLDRSSRLRLGRPFPPPPRGDRRAGPLLPRADVAAHTRVSDASGDVDGLAGWVGELSSLWLLNEPRSAGQRCSPPGGGLPSRARCSPPGGGLPSRADPHEVVGSPGGARGNRRKTTKQSPVLAGNPAWPG
jgi:putative flavoprotein involved in K+ transport